MNTPPNPYRPPATRLASADGNSTATPRGLKIAAATVACFTTLTAGLAPVALSSFRELFAGFGAELPLLSQVALGGMWIWTLLAVASIGVAIWIARTERASGAQLLRMRLAVALLAVATVVFLLVSLIALYLPIFKLGTVV